LLDRVDQWLAQDRRADEGLDQAGFLPAMTHWLRGRVELAEGRPQAALACFDDALALQSHGNLLVLATIGRAQALGMLSRHGAACEAVRAASTQLRGDPGGASAGQPRLRKTILQLLRERQEQRDHENALAYLQLALELTPETEPTIQLELLEQLGREYADAAAASTELERSQRWHATAAQTYEQAAERTRLDEPRYAALLWESANQFDLAGRTGDTRRMLSRFVAGRSLDPRMPQALLRLGQACAADGELVEAIGHYRELIALYPRLEESSRAQLLVANCLAALGEQHYPEAQAIFGSLLEDEHVAPTAQVFHDALFGLCDLLYQQQEYATAISRMEDFLVFYPEDPECYSIRFMLADAYRSSAHALLEDETAGPVAARQRVSRERFQRASDLFEAFGKEVRSAPTQDRVMEVYERLALFHRGDCLIELNEPTTLAEALAIYRQAAARYQGEPAALAAQVQITNIYLRQGKLIEAARAIERARWLLGSIPESAFMEQGDGMDRSAWDRYLSIVRSSHLFRNVFSRTP
jgi:tetratricopeptide (TPR) repeat protein